MLTEKQRIAKVLVDLADTLVDDFDVVDFTQRLCMHGSELLEMGAAGVMLLDGEGRFQVLAASSEEVEMLDMFQIQRDEGPCIESHRTGSYVRADDRNDLVRRWPRLGAIVAEHYESVYAFPMRHRGQMLGALGLYGTKARALDPDDAPLGQALADVATISLLQNQALHQATVLSHQLQNALTSRVVIEQAKGKYAERYSTGVGIAFEALRGYAQHNNRKLIDVATAFVNDEIDL